MSTEVTEEPRDAAAAAFWQDLFGPKAGRPGLRLMATGSVSFTPWDALLREAARRAGALRRRGVGPQATVAGVLTNSFDAVVGLFAVWWAGATFASLPGRWRGMPEAQYGAQLARMVADCGATLVFVEGLGDEGRLRAHRWCELDEPGSAGGDPRPPPSGAPAVVQYSSGSTGTPRGCMLSGGAIGAQMRILAEITQVQRRRDVACSWLPLSHDMGLFGALLFACVHDVDLALSTPERFVRSPRTWFGDLAATGAGLTPGTNSGLALAVRRQRRPLPQRLRLRAGIIGAEPIDWGVLQAANEVFGPSGLAPEALRPSYGMAEATLAVSCTPTGRSARCLVVDREALHDDVLEVLPADTPGPPTAVITSCGVPCSATEVSSSTSGIGELAIRSPSLADGYLGDPDATGLAFGDGVFRSNDRGFVHDGEVYVLGRTDDVLIHAGRNVDLVGLETVVAAALDGHGGQVTLIEHPSGDAADGVLALIEVPRPPEHPERLGRLVHEVVLGASGVPVGASVFVARGQLPLTPSGKRQRRRCAQLLDQGRFEVLASTGPIEPGGW